MRAAAPHLTAVRSRARVAPMVRPWLSVLVGVGLAALLARLGLGLPLATLLGVVVAAGAQARGVVERVALGALAAIALILARDVVPAAYPAWPTLPSSPVVAAAAVIVAAMLDGVRRRSRS